MKGRGVVLVWLGLVRSQARRGLGHGRRRVGAGVGDRTGWLTERERNYGVFRQ
jgi:hypothetical protein